MNAMRRQRRRWPWIVLALLVLGGALALTRRGTDAKEIESSLLIKVKRGELEIAVLETGKVQPREKVEIKSKVAGQVEKVLVDEGDSVKRGQLLLRLDPTDYRREVARAEADVAQAKNAKEFAELNLGRKRRGLAERGVSQMDVDAAESDVRAKAASLRTAEVLRQAAQDRLRYTQIYSPIGGTVIQRAIEPGEVVTPGIQATFEGRSLMVVGDLSTLLVRAELNQIDVAKVRLGQRVTLTLDALPGKQYEARITKIAPAAQTVKNKDVEVFPVEATLDKVDHQIKPGMTADARIHVEKRPGVLLLPIEAVAKEGGKSLVTKVTPAGGEKKKTDKVEVTIGARNDRELEILSGVTEGETVLIRPASSAENEYKM